MNFGGLYWYISIETVVFYTSEANLLLQYKNKYQ